MLKSFEIRFKLSGKDLYDRSDLKFFGSFTDFGSHLLGGNWVGAGATGKQVRARQNAPYLLAPGMVSSADVDCRRYLPEASKTFHLAVFSWKLRLKAL